MNKALFFPLQVSLCTVSCLYASSGITHAQVTSDGTLDTQVTQDGNIAEITGGETRGSNLFHSFQDFSVPTGNEAFFNNANDISNIFSRVTGGNLSNIDGLIRANGSASLFLINPAGIIFGQNARLDIGGSFYGSTASSILFEDGEFSAADLENPPLLTVNAPIGLGFRDNPGDIVNRSIVQNDAEEVIGLEVLSGNNLTFVGGNLSFEGGNLTAQGGNIELGSLSEAGVVDIEENGTLTFPVSIARGDITLSNASEVDVRSSGGGNINVNARSLTLEAGEFGSSFISSGIRSDSTNPEAQAGNVIINVAENITLNNSNINNRVNSGGVGNSGNITINTGSLELINGGFVTTSLQGLGNAGVISVTASGNISIDGEDLGGTPSGITSGVNSGAEGSSRGVTISTSNLNLTMGGRVDASTLGTGNAGAVQVNASGDITADGENSNGFPSGITSLVDTGAEGNSGGVTISTSNLNLTMGGRVSASTFGQGNANNLTIDAGESIFIDGEIARFRSSISANALNEDGNGGSVFITTGNITIANGGTIEATNFDNIGGERIPGTGRPGSINITANSIELTNAARIEAATQFAEGESSNINLNITKDIELRENSVISAQAFNEANGGNLDIDARFIIAFPNQIEGDGSDIVANAQQGIGGNININAESLLGIRERPLSNSTNDINASSQVSGLDGTISISAPDINPIQGATELPTNVVEPGETTTQACEANRESVAKNGLNITGKGGIPAEPGLPLNSFNITVNGQTSPTSTIPAPIETSQGKMQPARGIKVTESGEIILTAYRTNNSGERLPEIKQNCG